MNEDQKNIDESEDLSSLLVNNAENNQAIITEVEAKKASVFEKYKIKDIVFLAIMSACMLVTGAIMPIVGNIPVFGIVQVCLGIQFSLFPVMGMLKVGKPGSLVFMALFTGVVLLFMSTIMFFVTLLCAFIAEGLTLLIFRNEKSNKACVFASTIFLPLSLPFLSLYYNFMYEVTTEDGQAVTAYIGANGWVAFGMSMATLVVCFIGAMLGYIIIKELRKAGVIKK